MEEAEKMLALKKAYADIILNTAKEAAARVMASEKKALRFQQDLCSTKDEALRMLLRLKQMIDSKTTEAEITSLSQQRKIEELEAQLGEAEDTIIDLRTELKLAHDELDKVKSNHVGPLNGSIGKKDGYSNGSTMLENVTSSDRIIPFPKVSGPKAVLTPDTKIMSLNQRVLDDKCSNSAKQTTPSKSHVEPLCLGNPDLESMIVRNKDPELYRNGCTQRIRALETNLLDEKLSPSGEVYDQHFLSKNEPIIDLNEQKIAIRTVPSHSTENTHVMKNSDGLVEVPVKGGTYEDQHVKVRRLRRRKYRYGKAKATSCRSRPCQPIKPHQPSSVLSRCKTYSCTKNDDVKSVNGTCSLPYGKGESKNSVGNSSELEEKLQYKDQAIMVVRRSLRKRKIKYRDDIATSCRSLPNQLTEPCQRCSVLSRCSTCSLNCNAKSGEDWSNTLVDSEITTELDHLLGSGLTENAIYKDTELMDEPMSVKEDGERAQSPKIPSSKLSLETENVPLMDDDLKGTKTSEATNGAPILAENSTPLKYTFSRKRKKECLANPDESTSLGRSGTKKMILEQENGDLQPQKPSLINESSRDSRRLVQVARQLISLSGKRW